MSLTGISARLRRFVIKVVVIGGGTGSATMLRGLKTLDQLHLTSIVTVADSGGSTGRIRDRYHLPAMGDIRNVMSALGESESLLTSLMDYRFEDVRVPGEGRDVGGHNLGNLILTALIQKFGNMNTAIGEISKILKVKGDIIPSTTQTIQLYAQMIDGTIVMGEDNIPKDRNQIEKVFYTEQVEATPKAVSAIRDADVIVLGIGSLYTSILPNIIIEGIKESIQQAEAKVIYYCNVMTQLGETDLYSIEDHVRAIEKHGNFELDAVVIASDVIPFELREIYKTELSVPVKSDGTKQNFAKYRYPLLTFENNQVRHDPLLIARSFMHLLRQLQITGD